MYKICNLKIGLYLHTQQNEIGKTEMCIPSSKSYALQEIVYAKKEIYSVSSWKLTSTIYCH